MPTVEELVVSAKPEGINETTQDIDKMEQELDESAEQMGDTGSEFSAMGKKWKGAMGAIVAGLGVAVGGVLAQVPVIGEKMAQLGGIIDAVVFKIDQDLRPSMTGFGKDLPRLRKKLPIPKTHWMRYQLHLKAFGMPCNPGKRNL